VHGAVVLLRVVERIRRTITGALNRPSTRTQ